MLPLKTLSVNLGQSVRLVKIALHPIMKHKAACYSQLMKQPQKI